MTSAVLGAAGPISAWVDFPGAQRAGTWYVSALANKLAGEDLDPNPNPTGADLDIVTFFNSRLGQPGCLEGSGFYLGLDGNNPPNLDNLLSTVLHELGHGLGFLTLTDETTGEFLPASDNGPAFPTIYDHFAFDNTLNKLWTQMTSRKGSNPRLIRGSWYGKGSA